MSARETPGRSLLISGGAGFIGANFVHYWHRRHPADSIVVLDSLTYAGNVENLTAPLRSPNVRLIEGDICDGDKVLGLMQEHRCDTVVHFAAESHVDRSIAAPDAFVRTNVVGTLSLLAAARQYWSQTPEGGVPRRFHHVSTDEVFGSLEPQEAPFTEESRYQPNSPYAASKAGSDHLVRAYHKTYDLPVVGSNCSNNFGPYQHPEKLLPLMIIGTLTGRALPVYGDGMNVRDWLYVDDHCRAIESILMQGRLGVFYNVGGDNEWANLALVRVLCDTVDALFQSRADLASRFPDAPAARNARSSDLITFVKDRLGHDRRYAIDGARIAQDLGFRPTGDFQGALKRTIEWYIENEAWWRSVLKRGGRGS
jgi:dTDP-glucose 4,6-dehydratase